MPSISLTSAESWPKTAIILTDDSLIVYGLLSGLLERLRDGETIVAAEGYLFEFERRGYLKAGAFVPEVVVEHPELVKAVHEEYVHAGSDVVEAFTVRIKLIFP